jgi:hypothetical protein
LVLGLVARLGGGLGLLEARDLLVADRHERVVVGLQLVRRLELLEFLDRRLLDVQDLPEDRRVVLGVAGRLRAQRLDPVVRLLAQLVGFATEVRVAELRVVLVIASAARREP